MISELPYGAAVAIERLNVKEMRFKSRQMNRALRASQLSYVRDKLKFKLDERSIRYRSVQPAYSSQQCSICGFTFKMNRRNQSEFSCLFCGYSANADLNAARNIAERFGDDEINLCSFRELETVLALRFLRRHPVARSATAGPVPSSGGGGVGTGARPTIPLTKGGRGLCVGRELELLRFSESEPRGKG